MIHTRRRNHSTNAVMWRCNLPVWLRCIKFPTGHFARRPPPRCWPSCLPSDPNLSPGGQLSRNSESYRLFTVVKGYKRTQCLCPKNWYRAEQISGFSWDFLKLYFYGFSHWPPLEGNSGRTPWPPSALNSNPKDIKKITSMLFSGNLKWSMELWFMLHSISQTRYTAS